MRRDVPVGLVGPQRHQHRAEQRDLVLADENVNLRGCITLARLGALSERFLVAGVRDLDRPRLMPCLGVGSVSISSKCVHHIFAISSQSIS